MALVQPATRDIFETEGERLPTTDEGRLFFYSELLVANIPSLVSDLSSAKNTLLSFSEKKRSEVKQKSALIQSVSRSLNNAVSVYKSWAKMQELLRGYELQLVTAAPPEFLSAEEALARRTQQQQQESGEGPSTGHIIILEPEDLTGVREVEAAVRALEERSLSAQAESEKMLASFAEARAECEAMTTHVQSLRKTYSNVLAELAEVQLVLRHLEFTREEEEAREVIETDAATTLARVQVDCRNAELRLIQSAIHTAEQEVTDLYSELHTRRENNEVELAAFQIAWKDQQAQSDSLKDAITALMAHQRSLEELAKRQQLEESDRNSLRKYVASSLWGGEESSKLDKPLPAPRQQELDRDRPLAELLAARIHLLHEQRNTVAGLLTRVHDVNDKSTVSRVVTDITELLRDDVEVNQDALAGSTTPAKHPVSP